MTAHLTMRKLAALVLLGSASMVASRPALAQTAEGDGSGDDLFVDDIVITGTFEPEETTGGAVNVVTEEDLEQMRHTDPQAVLQQVPGVYVRQEDGYGLRPNIGIRGANSDRSKKVTLMDDGVLFGPAPYSAPAAYYFPMMYRMSGVEVWMGPAAIVFGPQTIGGAVNMLSRQIPDEREGVIDVAGGTDLFLRGYARYGASGDSGGYLVEVIHQHSNGFKQLDGGGNTGFDRTEAIARGRLVLTETEFSSQSLELRLGYSRERSNETYLGLSDADFAENPWRRYRASRLDEMEWDRTEARLTHNVELLERGTIRTDLYRHDMWRNWYKVNRFVDGPAIADILAAPDSGINQLYYEILIGNEDSSSPDENLGIGGNDRTFVSQGIQTNIDLELGRTGSIEHRLRAGLRLHQDSIIRNHSEDTYALVGGDLQRTDDARVVTERNRGNTLALADYATWEIGWRGLTLTPGVRTEAIFTSFEARLDETEQNDSQFVVLPGVGAHYAFTESFGVLAGVHQGFSPVSPGQAEGTEPERSTNYEAGLRWMDETLSGHAELVGFYNDYRNLTGECTFSTGCPESLLDRQFNAGKARIMGADVSFSMPIDLPARFTLPIRAAYTLTVTEFLEAFDSENPQFGEVEKGDELPYVPQHQASLTLGIARDGWGLNLSGTYTDAMRETAGQGALRDDDSTDAFAMLDVSAHYEVVDGLTIYARGENLNGATPIASRLPFGARPAKPRIAQAGISWEF